MTACPACLFAFVYNSEFGVLTFKALNDQGRVYWESVSVCSFTEWAYKIIFPKSAYFGQNMVSQDRSQT